MEYKGRNERKKITLDDLVNELGFSKATISLALNNSPLVADRTKTKVVKTAREMGYKPNYFASRLSRGKSETIGLYMIGDDRPSSNWTQSSNWMFYNPILKGITSVLSEADYRLRLELITTEQVTEKGVLVDAIQDGSLDGILLVVQYDMDYGFLDIVEETKFPLVVLNGGFRRNISSVSVDNELGAKLVVDYLVRNGHTDIAHIAGVSKDLNAIERKKGFIDATSLAGLNVSVNQIKFGDWQIESGRRLATELIRESRDITAIFCANDHMAIGAIQSLTAQGIRVPEDVSVLGFDNNEICEIVTPSLSSVRQPLDKVGELGAFNVLNLIKNQEVSSNHTKLEPELVIRQSSSVRTVGERTEKIHKRKI